MKWLNELTSSNLESQARAKECRGEPAQFERWASRQFQKINEIEEKNTQQREQNRREREARNMQRQSNAEIADSLSEIKNLLADQLAAEEEREQRRIAEERARWEASPEGQAELARREEARLQREAERAEERLLARELKKERRREAKKAQKLAAERKEKEADNKAKEAEERRRDHEEYMAKLRAEKGIEEKQEEGKGAIEAKQEKAKLLKTKKTQENEAKMGRKGLGWNLIKYLVIYPAVCIGIVLSLVAVWSMYQ